MRSRYVMSFLCGLTAGVLGCGDDTNKPDAAAPAFKKFDADEGGEIRVEYVSNATGVARARVTAFLFKSAGNTKHFPFPTFDGCTDMRQKTNWPMATNPLDQRVYLDPGNVIISGGAAPLTVERGAAAFNDPFARQHPANQWFFHFQPLPDMNGNPAPDGNKVPMGTKLDIEFTGGPEIPAQKFEDVAYIPAKMDPTTPGLGPVALPAGTAQTFAWSPVETAAPEEMMLSLVGFTGAMGPVVVCIKKNDGSISVPAGMIDIVRAAYPGGGTLARQTLTHVVRELVDVNGPTGRRIDILGIWCHATSFTVPAI